LTNCLPPYYIVGTKGVYMKNILLMLVALLLSACNLMDSVDPVPPKPAVVYPNTTIADARFNGVFTTTDDLGFTRITFNGTHKAHVYRFWTYTDPYSEAYHRHLTLETDGTLSAVYYPGWGYTHYEFLYNHATYSWSADGKQLTVNGKVHTKQ
jgi:hypothetical protein